MTETSYTTLRQNLASVLDRVSNDREVIIIRRKGDKKVAMVPADELIGLMETAHLLRSPRNAQRLLTTLRRATSGKGRPESFEHFRLAMGLDAQPQRASSQPRAPRHR
ncbi:MAG: type II toxin-antitoxin system prevent-host-death family antitoxin [Mycobacterium sp.]